MTRAFAHGSIFSLEIRDYSPHQNEDNVLATMRITYKTKFGLVKGHNSHLCISGLERNRDTD